jgi:hypothetical protein
MRPVAVPAAQPQVRSAGLFIFHYGWKNGSIRKVADRARLRIADWMATIMLNNAPVLKGAAFGCEAVLPGRIL